MIVYSFYWNVFDWSVENLFYFDGLGLSLWAIRGYSSIFLLGLNLLILEEQIGIVALWANFDKIIRVMLVFFFLHLPQVSNLIDMWSSHLIDYFILHQEIIATVAYYFCIFNLAFKLFRQISTEWILMLDCLKGDFILFGRIILFKDLYIEFLKGFLIDWFDCLASKFDLFLIMVLVDLLIFLIQRLLLFCDIVELGFHWPYLVRNRWVEWLCWI